MSQQETQSGTISRSTEERARAVHQRFVERASRTRAVRGVLMTVLTVLAGAFALVEYYFCAFVSLGLAIIWLLLFLDAHGQLQEIHRRTWRALVPGLVSRLQAAQSAAKTADQTIENGG